MSATSLSINSTRKKLLSRIATLEFYNRRLDLEELRRANFRREVQPRTGVWIVRSRVNQRLICLWAGVYAKNLATDINEHGCKVPVEKLFRGSVTIHRATPDSVPILLPRNGRSAFFRRRTIERFAIKNGFKAERVELSALDAKAISEFGVPWSQLNYDQSLKVLTKIGAE
jgi:hypothetical protein